MPSSTIGVSRKDDGQRRNPQYDAAVLQSLIDCVRAGSTGAAVIREPHPATHWSQPGNWMMLVSDLQNQEQLFGSQHRRAHMTGYPARVSSNLGVDQEASLSFVVHDSVGGSWDTPGWVTDAGLGTSTRAIAVPTLPTSAYMASAACGHSHSVSGSTSKAQSAEPAPAASCLLAPVRSSTPGVAAPSVRLLCLHTNWHALSDLQHAWDFMGLHETALALRVPTAFVTGIIISAVDYVIKTARPAFAEQQVSVRFAMNSKKLLASHLKNQLETSTLPSAAGLRTQHSKVPSPAVVEPLKACAEHNRFFEQSKGENHRQNKPSCGQV